MFTRKPCVTVIPIRFVPITPSPTIEPSSQPTILLVEDEDGIRELSRRVLKPQGYHVLIACDGVEALEICAAQPGKIDLVITDVHMPRMSGFELVERLSVSHPSMRVLFTSGESLEQLIEEGPPPPGSRFLGKPFFVGELIAIVQELLQTKPAQV